MMRAASAAAAEHGPMTPADWDAYYASPEARADWQAYERVKRERQIEAALRMRTDTPPPPTRTGSRARERRDSGGRSSSRGGSGDPDPSDPEPEPALAARWYARRLGFAVLPGRGREPLVGWKHTPDTPTDPEQIDRWWRRYPGADVVWLVGDRFAVLDVDVRAAHNGHDEVHELERAYRPLPDTPRALTPRDGVHIVFRRPPGVTVPAGELAPGVDLRTGRRIIALPPGEGRAWEISPAELELAVLPDWVIALANAGAASTNGVGCGEHLPPAGLVPHGERHPYLRDFVTRLLRAGITDPRRIAAHTRLEFELACAPDPPPESGYFEDWARWATRTRMAARERKTS